MDPLRNPPSDQQQQQQHMHSSPMIPSSFGMRSRRYQPYYNSPTYSSSHPMNSNDDRSSSSLRMHR
ncbi:unnamed protein product, partial [Rotaria sp. Silwood1]